MTKKGIAVAALVVVAVLSVTTARELSIGRAEVMAADAASEKSDFIDAIAHARAAAEALAPGSPWPARALRRLEAIGHDAEARGDDETAMLAYGAMRTASLETRALLLPGAGPDSWRSKADEGLVRIAVSRKVDRAEAAAMLESLRRGEPPATWTLALLAAGACATFGGLARLAWKTDSSRATRIAQTAAVAGLLCYVAALLTN